MKEKRRINFSLKIFTLLSIIFVFQLLSFQPLVEASSSKEFEEKRVLFISSYSPSFPTFFQQISGLRDTFEGYSITLDIEFMDSKRFFSEENKTSFYESISYKMESIEYDLIMVSDDNGTDFVMEFREELFDGLPIVFFGVNNSVNAINYSQNSLVTGVVEDISITDTINMALELNGNANSIIAITDNTPSGQADLTRFFNFASNYPSLNFETLDLSEISFSEFELELQGINNDSVILLLSALRDVEGTTYDFDESLDLILSNTTYPVYHLFEHGIGDGLLGGRVVSHYSQGKTAADIALSIFEGTHIANIALVDKSPNIYLVDFELIESFNFDKDKLPESTLFLNMNLSFFEENKDIIISITLVIIFQLAIIIALVLSVKNRNRARIQAENYNVELQSTYVTLEKQKILFESSLSNAGELLISAVDKKFNYLFFNESHKSNMKLLYDVDVHEGSNLLGLISNKHDRIKAKKNHDMALSGETYNVIEEFGDINKIVYELSYNPIFNNENDVLGVTLFAKNITEKINRQKEIVHISYHDSLTSLYNRRYYDENIDSFDVPENFPLTIVMSDINGLKLINDAFGHKSGDKLLTTASELILNSCREQDIVARVGGDEFAILMPNTTSDEAENVIKEINQKATSISINSITLSISFGIATKTDAKEDIHEIGQRAEDMMYRAKLIEIPSMRSGAIETILNTLYEKDKKSEIHSRVVSNISEKLAHAYGMASHQVAEVKTAGLLHDIGKIIIPLELLTKKGSLTIEEYNVIKNHPEIGFRILNSTHHMRSISNIVLCHHERWDGSGYPRGLKENNIPIQSRVIAIADAYDAMTSERSYRDVFSIRDALVEIKSNSGTQFDPDLVDIFINNFDQII